MQVSWDRGPNDAGTPKKANSDPLFVLVKSKFRTSDPNNPNAKLRGWPTIRETEELTFIVGPIEYTGDKGGFLTAVEGELYFPELDYDEPSLVPKEVEFASDIFRNQNPILSADSGIFPKYNVATSADLAAYPVFSWRDRVKENPADFNDFIICFVVAENSPDNLRSKQRVLTAWRIRVDQGLSAKDAEDLFVKLVEPRLGKANFVLAPTVSGAKKYLVFDADPNSEIRDKDIIEWSRKNAGGLVGTPHMVKFYMRGTNTMVDLRSENKAYSQRRAATMTF